MYVLVYLRYNENKRTSNSRKVVMPTGQMCKGNLEKVNSLLTSGEDVLISNAHIIKNGTPAIAQKALATLYKDNETVSLNCQDQRFRGSLYLVLPSQGLAGCTLAAWVVQHNLPRVFNSFPFLLGGVDTLETQELTKAYIDCFSVEYHSGPFF